MALNMSVLVYLPSQEIFSRPIVFTPIVSRPGVATYNARGILDTRAINVPAEDGSMVSDQETILDIRDAEFAVVPRQRDQLFIPADGSIPAAGHFEIVDIGANGGGETTLIIRELRAPRP